MSGITGFAVNSTLSPSLGIGLSGGPKTPSAGDLVQEDGTSFFNLENLSGILILE